MLPFATLYPLVVEVFYEIFKVSGQTPNTVMDNYVEPCDYKGYGGKVCPPARMYAYVR